MTTRKNTFKPGMSGNPAGRPPGSGSIGKLREGIAEHLPEIINRLVDQAKQGDAQAARLLLERVLPSLKPVEQPVSLSLPTGDGLSAQGAAIIQAVAGGTLAPGQAAQLLSGLGSLARIKEIDELTARIEKLEGMEHGNA